VGCTRVCTNTSEGGYSKRLEAVKAGAAPAVSGAAAAAQPVPLAAPDGLPAPGAGAPERRRPCERDRLRAEMRSGNELSYAHSQSARNWLKRTHDTKRGFTMLPRSLEMNLQFKSPHNDSQTEKKILIP